MFAFSVWGFFEHIIDDNILGEFKGQGLLVVQKQRIPKNGSLYLHLQIGKKSNF